jgi:hypothetical protein
MTLANVLVTALFLFCFPSDVEKLTASQSDSQIVGRVEYIDGSAAAGALVSAESTCTNTHLARETTSAPDGSFSIKAPDPTCNKYRLSASHREAFWLPTGDNIFYLVPNGTTPTVELKSGQTHPSVLLRLEQRGGEVDLRVFDEKTQSFVYAGLDIHQEPERNKTFAGSVSSATDLNGSGYRIFLPAGNYVATVANYMCHGKNYFSAVPPRLEFEIKAGIRQTLTMKIDIAKIPARSSYDNTKAARCSE